MPNFLTAFGYHFYFWSNEGVPLEDLHIHVSKTPHENSTKFWLNKDGTCELANDNPDNIPQKDLKKIMNTITIYAEDIEEKWKEFFKEEPTYHSDNILTDI